MKFTVAVIIATIILTGCASYGVMVTDQQAAQFKRGETTEAQIVAALGKPTTITTTNGSRTLAYTGVYAQARPSSFIPFIGVLVGGTDSQVSHVVFKMDEGGKLADVTSSQSTSGGGMNFAAGAPIPQTEDQPRRAAR